MAVKEALLNMIETNMLCPRPITPQNDLYSELGFDSLAFTRLLVEIEHAFSISFTLGEMHRCARVDTLIATVSQKLEKQESEGRGND